MNATEDHSAENLKQVAPVLDEAIEQLNTEDRTAILLRFFEQQDFRSIGAAIGSNEDAARMRVTRALDKLQVLLKERGVGVSAAALAAVLAGEAVSAAPTGLAGAVATGALATGTAASGAGALLKLAGLGKLKLGIAAALTVGVVATPVVIQHQTASALREENQALRQQVEQLGELQLENSRLSNLVAQAQSAPAVSPQEETELLKLRAEVTRLHQQGGELVRLREENQQFQSRQAASDAAARLRQRAEESLTQMNVCINYLRQIDGATQQCALEKNLHTNDVVTADDLLPFLKNNRMPVCPAGGSYNFGRVDQMPTCSVPGHTLQQ